jgi:hypothetical protein
MCAKERTISVDLPLQLHIRMGDQYGSDATQTGQTGGSLGEVDDSCCGKCRIEPL